MALSKIQNNSYDTNAVHGQRNLIINGNFSVWQRSTSQTAITSSGYHTADRWNINYGSTGLSHKQEQSSDVPDGFGYSLKVTATTQYSSLGAGDTYELDHRFEGQNLQQIKKGTSNAQPVTLSFWVKSSVTGTFICAFNDLDTSGQRMVSGAYTINAANTWEYKTITFPADTTGAFNNDNGLSARIIFCLAAGSNYTSGTLATSWEASSGGANTYVGQTNLFATLNATWQITGIQLEVGSDATPFEHRSFGDELARCQRYYEKTYPYASAPGTTASYGSIWGISIVGFDEETSGQRQIVMPWKVEKRTAPTLTIYDNAGNSGKVTTTDSAGTQTDNISTGLAFSGTSMYGAGPTNGAYAGLQFFCVGDAEL